MPSRLSMRRALLLAAVAACGLGAAILLWRVDPASSRRFPPCPLCALTGLLCPGCGTLRALHRLLHGEIAAAFRMNALAVTLSPWVLLGLLQHAFPALLPSMAAERASARSIWTLLAILVAFGIVRNVPIEPFLRLAPH